jgi:hypothetical protein
MDPNNNPGSGSAGANESEELKTLQAEVEALRAEKKQRQEVDAVIASKMEVGLTREQAHASLKHQAAYDQAREEQKAKDAETRKARPAARR